MPKLPAILGGAPVFDQFVQAVRTTVPPNDDLFPKISKMLESRRLSNGGEFVKEFERMICERLDVRNTVAMCNGTMTLVLCLKAMNLRGKIVVPSFTFCATAHAVVWAGLEPVFADIDPKTFSITPETVERVLDSDVSAIMPVTIFGSPCEVAGMQILAEERGLKLVFDSAQGMGSVYHGHPLGAFGDAESFSLHATKILPTGEGGLLTTNDDDLARFIRKSKNFGFEGESDCLMMGINAKMSEFSAIMGIEGLKRLDDAIVRRHQLVNTYELHLRNTPGLLLQSKLPGCRSNHQNFVVVVDEEAFGISRDLLADALRAENIGSRKYFYPPVHATPAYLAEFGHSEHALPNTRWVSDRVLSLPIHSDMEVETVERICEAIQEIHIHSGQLCGNPGGKPSEHTQVAKAS